MSKPSEYVPRDAMEKLDVESALAELGIRASLLEETALKGRKNFTKNGIYHQC